MLTSIIIPSFNRPKLLDLGLYSLSQQDIPYDIETIILNDGLLDNTEQICNKYSDKLNIRYIFTGQRNLNGEIKYRCPGFVLNIGVKQSKGDIIILSSPEIFHLNDTINMIIKPLEKFPNIISIPLLVFFDNKLIKKYLLHEKTLNIPNNLLTIKNLTKYNLGAAKVPYFMAFYKKHFMDIRGYDEDFIGYAADDNDLVDRLIRNGLKFHHTNALIIHLYHGKKFNPQTTKTNVQWMYNYHLYIQRKKQIIRNINKEWGKLE